MNSLFAPSPASEFVSPCFQVGGGGAGGEPIFTRKPVTQGIILTYVEYKAVSGVFQNIDPPPPLRECVLPPHKRLHSRQAVRGSIFWKTPDIGSASSSKNSLRYDPPTFEDSSPTPPPPHRKLLWYFYAVLRCKKYTPNCTYAMSRNIFNVPTGTHFARFFYTN